MLEVPDRQSTDLTSGGQCASFGREEDIRNKEFESANRQCPLFSAMGIHIVGLEKEMPVIQNGVGDSPNHKS